MCHRGRFHCRDVETDSTTEEKACNAVRFEYLNMADWQNYTKAPQISTRSEIWLWRWWEQEDDLKANAFEEELGRGRFILCGWSTMIKLDYITEAHYSNTHWGNTWPWIRRKKTRSLKKFQFICVAQTFSHTSSSWLSERHVLPLCANLIHHQRHQSDCSVPSHLWNVITNTL